MSSTLDATRKPMQVSVDAEKYAALLADASRYRWIREAKFIEIVTDKQMFRSDGGERLDRIIDVAATP